MEFKLEKLLKNKLVVALVIVAVILFLIFLYQLYNYLANDWYEGFASDATFTSFTATNPVKIQLSNPFIKNLDGDKVYVKWSGNLNDPIKITANLPASIIELYQDDKTLNKEYGFCRIKISGGNVAKPGFFYHSGVIKATFIDYVDGRDILSWKFIKLNNGKYLIMNHWNNAIGNTFIGYDKPTDNLIICSTWDPRIVAWDVDILSDSPMKTMPQDANNATFDTVNNVKTIRITSDIQTDNQLSMLGIMVYGADGSLIDLKLPSNGYNVGQTSQELGNDPNININTNVDINYKNATIVDPKGFNPVQSKTYNDPPGSTTWSYAKKPLEILYYSSNASAFGYPNRSRTLDTAISNYNIDNRYNGLFMPIGYFNTDNRVMDRMNYFSDTYTGTKPHTWQYKFSNVKDIAGIELIVWAYDQRNTNAKVEFLDAADNTITVGNFGPAAGFNDAHKVFTVKSFGQNPLALNTKKQLEFDAIFQDLKYYTKLFSSSDAKDSINKDNRNSGNITQLPSDIYQAQVFPSGKVYASGEVLTGRFYASNLWYNNNNGWIDTVGSAKDYLLPSTNATQSSTLISLGTGGNVNGVLTTGQMLVSPNGQFRMIITNDGIIKVIDSVNPLNPYWVSSTTAGPIGVYKLELQDTDGHLLLYNQQNTLVWKSGKYGVNAGTTNGAYKLTMQNDGNLVVYYNNTQAIWSIGISNRTLRPNYLFFNEYRFDEGKEFVLSSYTITTASDIKTNQSMTPTKWDLLGSNDGFIYDVIDTQVGDLIKLNINNNTLTYVPKRTPMPFRIYRIGILSVNSTVTPLKVKLGNIKLFGFENNTSTRFKNQIEFGSLSIIPTTPSTTTTTLPSTTTTTTTTTTTKQAIEQPIIQESTTTTQQPLPQAMPLQIQPQLQQPDLQSSNTLFTQNLQETNKYMEVTSPTPMAYKEPEVKPLVNQELLKLFDIDANTDEINDTTKNYTYDALANAQYNIYKSQL